MPLKLRHKFIFGDWGLGPIPNPQSPIPNPQSPFNKKYKAYVFNKHLLIKKNLII